MDVTAAGPEHRADLEALAAAHPHPALRALDRLGPPVAHAEVAHRLTAALATPGAVVAIGHAADGAVGCAAVVPLAFETDVLGVGTGRLVDIVVLGDGPDLRAARAEELLTAAGRWWGDAGGRLVVATIDTDDHAVLAGAQRAGYVVLEASTTYLAHHGRPVPHHHRDRGFSVRRLGVAEARAVPRSELATLERWVGRSYRHGHLHADPRIDRRAADAFYVRWMRNSFDGTYGDIVLAAWRGGEVVGFVSWIEQPDFHARHGVDFLAGGLGAAVDPEGRGALGDIYAAALATDALGDRVAEHPTQLGNLAVHATFARFPGLRLAEAHLTLHAWV